MEKTLSSLSAFSAEAEAFAKALVPSTSGATLVTLSGELGAGKTTFVQSVARALGLTERVQSPTFVLIKRYALPEGQPFATLVHIDAYRLQGGLELEKLGLRTLLADPQTLIMLEWPEHVDEGLLKGAQVLTLRVSSEGERVMDS